MSALGSMAEAALAAVELVGIAVVHGTVLAALAWLLSATLLRRARPAVLAALWMVVLIKFVLPVGPAMPWSISDLLALAAGGGDAALAPWVVPGVAPVAAVAAPGIDLAGAAALIGVGLWLAAVLVLVTRRLRGQRQALRRALALELAPAGVVELTRQVAARLGVTRLPALRVDPTGTSPWVAGIRRPVVVMPAAMLAQPVELAAALAHELGHLRRRDAWLRLVQVAVGSAFFFWPVVRRINRRIDAAREMACDAYAIAHGPLPAPAYARLLVRLVRSGAPEGSFALAATPRLLRGRVDALLVARPGTGPGIGKLGAIGLAAWTAIALGGASRAGAGSSHGEVCLFTPALASSFLAAHPEADADRDGVLTRDEACDFQLELRRRIVDETEVGYDPAFDTDGDGALSPAEAATRRDQLASQVPGSALAATSPLAAEPMCCNCGEGEGTSSPPTGLIFRANEPANTCVRGVDP